MTPKLPAIMFYTGDWMKDPSVSQCSPSTRGIWVDALCAMHESGRSGTLSGTPESLSRCLRCSLPELQAALRELAATGTANIAERNGTVTLINRRMMRDHKSRNATRLRVNRARGKPPCNASDTPLQHPCNAPLSVAVSNSVATSQNGTSVIPVIEKVSKHRFTDVPSPEPTAPQSDAARINRQCNETDLMRRLRELLGDDEMKTSEGHWRVNHVRKHPELVDYLLTHLRELKAGNWQFRNAAAWLETSIQNELRKRIKTT